MPQKNDKIGCYEFSKLKAIPYLEAKLKADSSTYEHCKNVANLSLRLVKQTNLNIDEALIYYSGLFHDIGKTVIIPELLNKKEPLSDWEYQQIQEHSTLGFQILQRFHLPAEILYAALLHHEKYDGSGYPMGYTGGKIPVIARIVHISDVFDALTSDRPYRKALSIQETLNIMEKSKRDFNPELYSVFLSTCL